jgi:hypothetical protein
MTVFILVSRVVALEARFSVYHDDMVRILSHTLKLRKKRNRLRHQVLHSLENSKTVWSL